MKLKKRFYGVGYGFLLSIMIPSLVFAQTIRRVDEPSNQELTLSQALQGNEKAFVSEKQARKVRIKDLVEVRGVRSNQLIGFGLVVGLAGTGDSRSSLTTNQAVVNLLNKFGFSVSSKDVVTKNIAAVMVTADLPPFARIGDKISVRVSSVGDASSLEGGTLLLTPLTAADEQVYAVVQGPVSLGSALIGAQGGRQASGNAAAFSSKTVGLVHNATVEREFAQTFIHNNTIELSLRRADFTTATRIALAINRFLGTFAAEAQNAGLVRVKVPESVLFNKSFDAVAFMSTLEQLEVEPDSRALVVINERTGTIVAGEHVRLKPATISHGGLEIVIPASGDVSSLQAGAAAGNDNSAATGNTANSRMVGSVPATATVADLVSALNALGVGPKDLVAILQALDAAEALEGSLQFL